MLQFYLVGGAVIAAIALYRFIKKQHRTETSSDLLQCIEGCYSEYPLQSMVKIRSLLSSSDSTPPIQQIIDSGVIPQIIKLLKQNNYKFEMFMAGYVRELNFEYIMHQDIIKQIDKFCERDGIDSKLQCEGRWILQIIAAATREQTQYIVDQGAIPILMDGLKETMPIEVKESSILALAHIAAVRPENRDLLLEGHILDDLISILQTLPMDTNKWEEIELLRSVSFTLYHICHKYNEPAKPKYLSSILNGLSLLRGTNDVEIGIYIARSFRCIAMSEASLIHDSSLSHIFELFQHKSKEIQLLILDVLCTISGRSYYDIQQLIDLGLLQKLSWFLYHEKDENILRMTCWIFGNIIVCGSSHIEQVIEANLFPKLIEILESGQYETAKEALLAICNALRGGTFPQMKAIVDLGVVPALVSWLKRAKRSTISDIEEMRNLLQALEIVAVQGVKYRDLLLENNILDHLISIIQNIAIDTEKSEEIKLLEFTVAILRHLCCTDNQPSPEQRYLSLILKALSFLRGTNNKDISLQMAWCFKNIAMSDATLINHSSYSHIFELFEHESKKINGPMLRTIAEISSGSDDDRQQLIDLGLLKKLEFFLVHENFDEYDHIIHSYVENGCFILSNITAGTSRQIEQVMRANLFPKLIEILNNEQYEEAMKVLQPIVNVLQNDPLPNEHIGFLVNLGVITVSCSQLKQLKETNQCSTVLKALKRLLLAAETTKYSKEAMNQFHEGLGEYLPVNRNRHKICKDILDVDFDQN